MTEDEINTFDKLLKRQQLTLDNMSYNIQRLDLLIISVSGAAIYSCLETTKFMIENKKSMDSTIVFAGFLFTISIIFNLISQYTGYTSNKYDYYMCKKKIDCNGKEIEELSQKEIKKLDKLSQIFDNATTYLNLLSLGLLVIGLVFLMLFYKKFIC